MPNIVEPLHGALLRAPMTAPLYGIGSGRWVGRATIASGGSFVAVPATFVASDSIILPGFPETSNGALKDLLIVTSKVPGVGFCFRVNSITAGTVSDNVVINWMLVQVS